MLDVLHFFFEEDVLSSETKEGLDAKEQVRTTMYGELYGIEYRYRSSSSVSHFDMDEIGDPLEVAENENAPVPVSLQRDSASAAVTKRYIPATPVNSQSRLPFGSSIDAPLG